MPNGVFTSVFLILEASSLWVKCFRVLEIQYSHLFPDHARSPNMFHIPRRNHLLGGPISWLRLNCIPVYLTHDMAIHTSPTGLWVSLWRENVCHSARRVTVWLGQNSTWFDWMTTPPELNIEPKNGQIRQENDLPRCHFRDAMFGLQIVKVQKWNTFIVSGKNTGLEGKLSQTRGKHGKTCSRPAISHSNPRMLLGRKIILLKMYNQTFCQVPGSGGYQFRVLSQLPYALLTGISHTYRIPK